MSAELYHRRLITDRLLRTSDAFPVTVLLGARQTGKTTLLRREFSDWRYIDLDDLDQLDEAQRDPKGLVSHGDRVIIDEVQRAPQLILAVKQRVDQAREVRFILTGSSNLLLMKNIADTLAGRAVYLPIRPFTLWELADVEPPVDPLFGDDPSALKGLDVATTLRRGLMPPLLAHEDDYGLWWEGYLRTYLERDIRDLARITSVPDFRRVMRLLAAGAGSPINESAISRAVGISQSSVSRYVSLLEMSLAFQRLSPWTASRAKRIAKRPKGYFWDPGLVFHLNGGDRPEDRGQRFEALVHLHLQVLVDTRLSPQARLLFWRDSAGHEVDFLIEDRDHVVAIEVKAGARVRPRDARGIHKLTDSTTITRGIVAYTGEAVERLSGEVWALPFPWLGGGV